MKFQVGFLALSLYFSVIDGFSYLWMGRLCKKAMLMSYFLFRQLTTVMQYLKSFFETPLCSATVQNQKCNIFDFTELILRSCSSQRLGKKTLPAFVDSSLGRELLPLTTI